MPAGSYEVRSIDHPGRRAVVHLEVVEREVLEAFTHRIRELEAQVARLKAQNERLRKRVAA